jgi:hypothetical protein
MKLNIFYFLDSNIIGKQRESLARWKEERGESRSICSAQLQTCCLACSLLELLSVEIEFLFCFRFLQA